MQRDWLPNWRDKDAYPSPQNTPMKKWAWEFLRRNKSYQKDFFNMIERLQSMGYFELQNKPGPLTLEEHKKYSEFCHEIDQKIITKYRVKSGRNMPADPRYSYEEEKPLFLGSSTLLFHDCFYRESPESNFQYQTHKYEENIDYSTQPIIDKEACEKGSRIPQSVRAHPKALLVEISLEKSIPEQIRILEDVAKKQKKILISWGLLNTGRNRSDSWREYLQLLDAIDQQASPEEVSQHLFPLLTNEYPDYQAKKRYDNWRKRAKKIRDIDYLKIALLDLT